MKLFSLRRLALFGVAILATAGIAALAANMSFSTGATFITGPRLIDGSDLNTMVTAVNTLIAKSLGTTAGVYTGTFNGTVGATTPSTVAATTVNASGVTTPTGGIAAAAGGSISPRNIFSCAQPAIATTSGTDSTPSVTEQYVAEVFVPANMTVTGVAYLGGSATGSGN